MADVTQNSNINNLKETPVLKTPKQLEKEAKKQAKLEKLKQKLDKQNVGLKKDTEVSFCNICHVDNFSKKIVIFE